MYFETALKEQFKPPTSQPLRLTRAFRTFVVFKTKRSPGRIYFFKSLKDASSVRPFCKRAKASTRPGRWALAYQFIRVTRIEVTQSYWRIIHCPLKKKKAPTRPFSRILLSPSLVIKLRLPLRSAAVLADLCLRTQSKT